MAHLKHRRHLFFDLDDTLWDFEKNTAEVLHELYDEFNLQNKIGTSVKAFCEAYKSVNENLWRQYRAKEIDKSFMRNNRFAMAFQRFDYENYDDSLLVSAAYLQRAPLGRHLKDGCIEILNYLQNNHTLHIITNGFKETQQIKINGCGLKDFFSNIIIGEEHNFTKPDKEIFAIAETFAKAKSDACVMIGDNFDCDVTGALNAGWESIYFKEGEHTYSGHAIKNLQQLKNYF